MEEAKMPLICIDRLMEKGVYTKYKLKDLKSGQCIVADANMVKSRFRTLDIVNMTLTSDGRLIIKEMPKQDTTQARTTIQSNKTIQSNNKNDTGKMMTNIIDDSVNIPSKTFCTIINNIANSVALKNNEASNVFVNITVQGNEKDISKYLGRTGMLVDFGGNSVGKSTIDLGNNTVALVNLSKFTNADMTDLPKYYRKLYAYEINKRIENTTGLKNYTLDIKFISSKNLLLCHYERLLEIRSISNLFMCDLDNHKDKIRARTVFTLNNIVMKSDSKIPVLDTRKAVVLHNIDMSESHVDDVFDDSNKNFINYLITSEKAASKFFLSGLVSLKTPTEMQEFSIETLRGLPIYNAYPTYFGTDKLYDFETDKLYEACKYIKEIVLNDKLKYIASDIILANNSDKYIVLPRDLGYKYVKTSHLSRGDCNKKPGSLLGATIYLAYKPSDNYAKAILNLSKVKTENFLSLINVESYRHNSYTTIGNSSLKGQIVQIILPRIKNVSRFGVDLDSKEFEYTKIPFKHDSVDAYYSNEHNFWIQLTPRDRVYCDVHKCIEKFDALELTLPQTDIRFNNKDTLISICHGRLDLGDKYNYKVYMSINDALNTYINLPRTAQELNRFMEVVGKQPLLTKEYIDKISASPDEFKKAAVNPLVTLYRVIKPGDKEFKNSVLTAIYRFIALHYNSNVDFFDIYETEILMKLGTKPTLASLLFYRGKLDINFEVDRSKSITIDIEPDKLPDKLKVGNYTPTPYLEDFIQDVDDKELLRHIIIQDTIPDGAQEINSCELFKSYAATTNGERSYIIVPNQSVQYIQLHSDKNIRRWTELKYDMPSDGIETLDIISDIPCTLKYAGDAKSINIKNLIINGLADNYVYARKSLKNLNIENVYMTDNRYLSGKTLMICQGDSSKKIDNISIELAGLIGRKDSAGNSEFVPLRNLKGLKLLDHILTDNIPTDNLAGLMGFQLEACSAESHFKGRTSKLLEINNVNISSRLPIPVMVSLNDIQYELHSELVAIVDNLKLSGNINRLRTYDGIINSKRKKFWLEDDYQTVKVRNLEVTGPCFGMTTISCTAFLWNNLEKVRIASDEFMVQPMTYYDADTKPTIKFGKNMTELIIESSDVVICKPLEVDGSPVRGKIWATDSFIPDNSRYKEIIFELNDDNLPNINVADTSVDLYARKHKYKPFRI